MTRSLSSRLGSLSLTLVLALVAVAGCAGQGDIDRTQPDKVDKSIFFDKAGNPKVWYYRQTAVGFPPTTNWAFDGMQGPLQKIRFLITKDKLIGYRAYDYVIGFANDFTGGVNNTDTPIVTYNIASHFDVKREYNPATGEETNVVSENDRDRPWDQRQYMRVDWSMNLSQLGDPLAPPDFDPDPISQFLKGKHAMLADSYVSETDVNSAEFKDRPLMRSDIIDFVSRQTFTPDYNTCMGVWDAVFDDNGPWNCGEAEVKMRHSFVAVKDSTSYEPLEYPDNFPLLDGEGKAIQLLNGNYPCSQGMIASSGGQYSGADCGPAQVGAFSKFGYFRTVRQVYDRKYGNTELGRKYYANRWNIWQDTAKRDEKGNPLLKADGTIDRIPEEERVPKPITYYTNVEFSDDPMLFDEAKAVVNDWSDALKKTVAGLQLTTVGNATQADIDTQAAMVPEMVVLKRNSCNLTDFKAYLDQHGDIAARVERATGQSADDLDKAHLAHACSVAEAATENLPDTDAKKFAWQRNGDLRYSFFYWVDRPQAAGPLGYGPSSADPETGEIISATAYNYGGALDTYAQMAADTVELLNGDINVDDLLSGKTIADVLKDTAQVRQATNAIQKVTPEAQTRATSLLRRGQPAGSAPELIPIPAGALSSKLDMLKGTAAEREMITPDLIAAMLPELDKDGQSALTPEQINRISPLNWLSDRARASRRDRFQKLAKNGCVYMGEFADDAIMGLAVSLKGQGLSGDALFRALRRLIFRGLADHEMGHTMGLRHNFAGSSDAFNYHDRYWQIRTQMPETQWDANSLGEYQYSTVMDYGSRFNSDVHGLGKYDMAAIRFGYGQLVDVMPVTTGYTATDGSFVQETGEQLANELFFKDYKRIPELLGGADKIANTGVSRYKPIIDDLTAGYLDPRYRGGYFLTAERPYKFCSDEFVGNLDCKPWDHGANQQEIVDDTIDRYKNYYYFYAYKRGRLAWTLDTYINRLLERYYSRYTEAFQFYFFYGDYLNQLNAGGYQIDLGNDLLKASIDSLNALGEVMQTPEPGMHCTTTVSPDVMVLPDPSGPNACQSGAPFMNIRIPDGKPYYIDFSTDYYYRITRAGSLYEKLAGIIALTSTDARFFRVDTFADSNNYSVNYYRLFKDEMLNLLGGVIRNDPTSYGGYVMPGVASYQATPVVDLTTWGKVRFDPPPYMTTAAKRVDTPVNKTIRYYALAFGLSNLNSTWDSTLDLANYTMVNVKGSNDDVTYDANTVVHEFTHPQSGLVYRAPQFDPRKGIGVQLVDELNLLVGKVGVAGTLPTKYGFYTNGTGLPDWQTAKKAVADALALGDQAAYDRAFDAFQAVDYLIGYRIDLLDDLRFFKTMFGY